jgi:hypothetical protein
VIHTGDSSIITAGNGNNTIIASGGHNQITDGDGNDSIFLLNASNPGFNSVILGNGNNFVFLTGSSNFVLDGSGSDRIIAGSGNDTFMPSGAGGSVTIDNFNSSDHLNLQLILDGLSLTPTEAGLANNITVTEQAHSLCGLHWSDTLITVTGLGGTAHIDLENYSAGGLAGLLSHDTLVLPG